MSITYGAYQDLFTVLPQLSTAKQELLDASLNSAHDYVVGVSDMLTSIRKRAEADAKSGGEAPEELFPQIDRWFDAEQRAKQFRQNANELIFIFDKKSRTRLRDTADHVEDMGKALRQVGAKQMYGIARAEAEKILRQAAPKAASSLRMTGQTAPPDDLPKGTPFIIQGTIHSNYAITSVTAGVFDASGNMVTGHSASPQNHSYDVKAGLDRHVYFNHLPTGVFHFRITASDESGITLVLVDKRFTVADAGSLPKPDNGTAEKRRIGHVYNTGSYGLVLRDIPSTKAKQIGSLWDGAQVTVLGDGTTGGYYKIEYNGVVGYGTAQYIRLAEEQAPQQAGSVSSSLATVRSTAPAKDNTYYYNNANIFYASGYSPPFSYKEQRIYGNCTWYAWGRLYELTGQKPGGGTNVFSSNAHTWWDRNIEQGMYSYGSEPRPGAIAVWGTEYPGGLGHVAIVEKIENGVVYLSESGWISLEFRYTDTSQHPAKGFKGYIYVI